MTDNQVIALPAERVFCERQGKWTVEPKGYTVENGDWQKEMRQKYLWYWNHLIKQHPFKPLCKPPSAQTVLKKAVKETLAHG